MRIAIPSFDIGKDVWMYEWCGIGGIDDMCVNSGSIGGRKGILEFSRWTSLFRVSEREGWRSLGFVDWEDIYIYIVLHLSNFHERFTKCMLTINQYDWKLRWRHESGENGGLTSKCYIYLPTHLCTAVTLRIAMSGPLTLTLTLKPQEYQYSRVYYNNTETKEG